MKRFDEAMSNVFISRGKLIVHDQWLNGMTKIFLPLLFYYFLHTTPQPPPKKKGRIGDTDGRPFKRPIGQKFLLLRGMMIMLFQSTAADEVESVTSLE